MKEIFWELNLFVETMN